MARQKRQKKSTATNQAKTFEDATKTHPPPVKLDQDELRVFHALVASKEWDTWSDNDLLIAADIAKIQVEMDQLKTQYRAEGHKIVQPNGNEAVNPTFVVWEKLAAKRLQLTRALGLSASQRGQTSSDQKGRNKQQVQKKHKLASVSPLLK